MAVPPETLGAAARSPSLGERPCSTEFATVDTGPTAGNSQMKALLLISSGVFGALSIWFVASAVLQPLKVEWGFSDVQGSFLTSVVNLGFCLGCFFSALLNLADVFSAPTLILVGGLSAAVANASLLLVRGFWGALLMRCLVGLGLSLVYPPSVKLLSTWYSADKRSAAMGVLFSFFCIGSAFPQLLNALATGYSWRLIVGLSSLLGAVASGMIYAFVETGPFPFPRSSFDARTALRLCRNRNVALSILAYCGHQWEPGTSTAACGAWELFCVWAWSAEFFEHIWGTSQQSAHMWAFVIISMGGPGSWLGGLLGDRYGRAMSALLMVSVSGLCTLVLGVVENHWPFAIWICICLLWGLTALADSPNYSALVTLHAEQSNVGTAVTVQLFCGYLATVLALWLVPLLSSTWSWRWSLASLSLGPALSVLALLLLRPRAKDVEDLEGSIKGPASSDAP
eukprot:s657_g12.t1